ncbi:cytochrome c5 family protein [Gilvimarinus sp. SDUM040014]|uniref:Cytochrome c5 family protein n=2 Tax=Gilvimarinus algae TaxID=3058037 RepID=A0ABT8TG37_9GAMM|nr:cytochrome c5 family protein [Gilvimarinus sp. SDUM040014]MDO3383042.1 cytochrome c5 family protein [Gilvimarinus sp. SDUM040014]
MVALGLGLAASGFAFSQSSAVKGEISERIAPAGSVCMSGDDCAAAPVAAASSGPRSGEEVYNSSCNTCHGVGVAGAPKYGDVADWEPRIAKGMDTLYTHAISGFNGMPAMGLCATCSEDEIKASVDYMVDNSQ